MKVPNLQIEGNFINEEGTINTISKGMFTQLFSEMQKNLSDEGFFIPQQPTNTINESLNTDRSKGAILYDSTTNQFKGNVNGKYKVFQQINFDIVEVGFMEMVPDNVYIVNVADRTDLLLPKKCKPKQIIHVWGFSGGFKINQNENQRIFFNGASTGLGASGYLESLGANSCVSFVCVIEDREFLVFSSVASFTII